MFSIRKIHTIVYAVSILLLACGSVYAQAALTNDSVIKLVTAGLGEEVILSMVNTQPAQYSVTPDDLIALKKGGVSDKIIAAMVTKTQGGAPQVKAVDSSAAAAADAGPVQDVGVYFKKNNEWVEVLPEIVNWKTGGILKKVASAGIVKQDVNGNIPNQHSRNSVATPLEFLIRTSEGVAITEYQLIRLRENKKDREFRTVTGGVLHQSGGATRDMVPFEGKRAANRTFSVVLPNNLGVGEYGFLPPGAAISSSAASVGKMYTFRILE